MKREKPYSWRAAAASSVIAATMVVVTWVFMGIGGVLLQGALFTYRMFLGTLGRDTSPEGVVIIQNIGLHGARHNAITLVMWFWWVYVMVIAYILYLHGHSTRRFVWALACVHGVLLQLGIVGGLVLIALLTPQTPPVESNEGGALISRVIAAGDWTLPVLAVSFCAARWRRWRRVASPAVM